MTDESVPAATLKIRGILWACTFAVIVFVSFTAGYMVALRPASGRRGVNGAQETADAVLTAITMAKSKQPDRAVRGMEVLAQHWKDPRSEQALAEIARGEPKHIGDGLLTVHGRALLLLRIVRAKKEHHALLEGKQSSEEQLKAVRTAFAKHPDWLDPLKRPHDKVELVPMLIKTAVRTGGGTVVDLVFESGCFTGVEVMAYVKKHPREAVAYAQEIGLERSLSFHWFVDALYFEAGSDGEKLVKGWLQTTQDEDLIDGLLGVVSRGKGARDYLLTMLEDRRPAVVKGAALRIGHRFPDPEVLAAIEAALVRRKKEGAPAKELQFLQAVTQGVQTEIAEEKDK
jgi:hypothetical protein